MNINNKLVFMISMLLSLSLSATEEEKTEKKLQDMSDPLAVFTQVGLGYTDRGLNLKIGKAYDPGKPATMAMNVLEIQGVYGETLGFRDDAVDSIDSVRFRNFSINLKSGLGNQIDTSWNFNNNTGSASYSLIQALPKVGIFNFYPLAGVGIAMANNLDQNANGWSDSNSPSGLSVPGAFANIGMFSKVTITKNLWINYNPLWLTSIGGSNGYKDNTYGQGVDSILTHELAFSYQVSPRFNVRYFANWSNEVDFTDGGHRIEFNYQL